MKRLLIMRHAKSSRDDANLPDEKRPLNSRGQRDAPLMGELAASKNIVPELILSSTAVRAATTAELFVKGLGKRTRLGLDRNLYRADVEEFCDSLREGADSEKSVMIVSHNPGVERWVYALTGQFETMPTAAIAVVRLSDKVEWQELTALTKGELETVWRPREVLSE